MSFDNRSSTVDGNSSNPEIQSQSASLCKTGCGFYGNPIQEGLCSKCYKDKVKRLQPNLPSNSNSTAHPPSPTTQSEAKSLFSSSSSSTPPSTSANLEICSEASGGAEPPHEEPSDDIQRTSETVIEQASQESLTPETSNAEINVADTASVAFPEAEAGTGKPKKNRCLACNKKVGLTGFGCRCGGLFCSMHRYSDMHNCNFDYKEHAQDQIRKNNPVVVGKKIMKI